MGLELWPRLKHAAIGPTYFKFYILYFLFLTMAAFKKRGSSLPKAAFYRCGFKFSLKPRV